MDLTYTQSLIFAPSYKLDESRLSNYFCPDEILNPALRNYKKLRDAFRAASSYSAHFPKRFSHKKYTHEEALSLKDECLTILDPDNNFDFQDMSKGYFVTYQNPISAGNVKPSYGHWEIFLLQNNSIEDVFNMAHEYGHFIANRKLENPRERTIPFYLAEAQAFFLEACAFDLSSQKKDFKEDSALAKAQRILEQTEYFGMSIRANRICRSKSFEKNDPISQMKFLQVAENLHHHQIGIVLGFELYRLFKSSPENVKQNLLFELYGRGEEVSIKSILAVVDIHTAKALNSLFKDGFEHLSDHCTASVGAPNYKLA